MTYEPTIRRTVIRMIFRMIPVLLGSLFWAFAASAEQDADPSPAVAPGDTLPSVSDVELELRDAAELVSAAAIRADGGWPSISSAGAILMTPVFPGWGQLYTRNSWRAATTWGIISWYWSQMLRNDRLAERRQDWARHLPEDSITRGLYGDVIKENRELVLDYAWWSAGGLLIACLDAYVGALLYRFDEDAVKVPNDWHLLEPVSVLDPATGLSEPGIVLFEWRKQF